MTNDQKNEDLRKALQDSFWEAGSPVEAFVVIGSFKNHKGFASASGSHKELRYALGAAMMENIGLEHIILDALRTIQSYKEEMKIDSDFKIINL